MRVMQAEEELIREIQQSRERMFGELMVVEGGEGAREAVRRLYWEGSQEGFTPKVAKELWESAHKEAAFKRELGEKLAEDYRQCIDEKVREIRSFKEMLLDIFGGKAK